MKVLTSITVLILAISGFCQEVSSESDLKSFDIQKPSQCEGESFGTYYDISSPLITEGETPYSIYFDLQSENKTEAESTPVTYDISNSLEKKIAQEKLVTLIANNSAETESETVKEIISFSTSEKRVALLIGNSDYTTTAKLKNPVNDVNLMKVVLDSLNFEVVMVTNGSYNSMLTGLRKFSITAKDADIALFYYAGHGLQFDGKNYLIPVDANIETKETVALETLDVDLVMKTLEIIKSKDRLNLVILDACRNNPFNTWSRGGNSGLAASSPTNGTIIAYSTSPNSTASDGSGSNGLYTEELAKQLLSPQRIEDVFIKTRVAVEEKSMGQQSPWELARLRASYSLIKK